MQPHRSTIPQVMRQRSVEFERAETPRDVDKLLGKWQAEDAELPYREQLLTDKVARLERALRTLEAKVAAMPAAIGRSLGQLRQELAAHLGARIDAVEARPAGLRYCGVWDQARSYSCDDFVTHNGGGWVALSPMAAGVKPGEGANAWKLAVKSNVAELTKLVRAEVAKQLGSKPGKMQKEK